MPCTDAKQVQAAERRHLDKGQKIALAIDLEPHFAKEAKRRMAAGGGDKRSKDAKSGVGKSTTPDQAKSRDQAAKAVGVSGKLVSAAKAIKEADPERFWPHPARLWRSWRAWARATKASFNPRGADRRMSPILSKLGRVAAVAGGGDDADAGGTRGLRVAADAIEPTTWNVARVSAVTVSQGAR